MVADQSPPIGADRAQRIAEERGDLDRRYTRRARRRVESQQQLDGGTDRTELGEELVEHSVEHRAGDVGDGVRGREIERGVGVTGDRDAVGGQDERRAAAGVEREPGAKRINLRIAGQDPRPAIGPLADVEIGGEPWQRGRRSRREIDRQQIGVGANADVRTSVHCHAQERREDGVAPGAGGGSNAERELRRAQ